MSGMAPVVSCAWLWIAAAAAAPLRRDHRMGHLDAGQMTAPQPGDFAGWTPEMLKSRIRAIATINQEWIGSLQREIERLERERNELFRLLLVGGDTQIVGMAAHIAVTITWPNGRPYGLSNEEIAEMAP